MGEGRAGQDGQVVGGVVPVEVSTRGWGVTGPGATQRGPAELVERCVTVSVGGAGEPGDGLAGDLAGGVAAPRQGSERRRALLDGGGGGPASVVEGVAVDVHAGGERELRDRTVGVAGVAEGPARPVRDRFRPSRVVVATRGRAEAGVVHRGEQATPVVAVADDGTGPVRHGDEPAHAVVGVARGAAAVGHCCPPTVGRIGEGDVGGHATTVGVRLERLALPAPRRRVVGQTGPVAAFEHAEQVDAAGPGAQPHISGMYAADHVSAHLGIELVAAMEGTATMRLVVGESMVNGHGLCHGGMLFTLADSACAYAANSWGEDALSTGASIEFLQPAGLGEVLTATAQETARSGRRAVLDVMVTAGDGRTVATFRGVTTQLRRA